MDIVMNFNIAVAGNTNLTVAATGHRPPRLGLDYDWHSNRLLTEFATAYLSLVRKRAREKRLSLGRVISGMAQGWDQAVAHAAIKLGVPLTAALPFDGHGANWPDAARRRHDAILDHAEVKVVVCPGPYKGAGDAHKYIRRDEWMVDEAMESGCGVLFALWDGLKKGGTWQTVSYAERAEMRVFNAWENWKWFLSSRGVVRGVNLKTEAPNNGEAARGVEHPSR